MIPGRWLAELLLAVLIGSRFSATKRLHLSILLGVVEDLDVGFPRSEDLLGAFQGVAGGDVGVARTEKEEVAFTRLTVAVLLEDFKDARELEDAVDLA